MIKKHPLLLISSLFSLIGGMIWIWMGSQLSILPPANPEIGYYRSSHFDIMPWLGFGLACIGIGFIGLNVLLQAIRTSYSFFVYPGIDWLLFLLFRHINPVIHGLKYRI